MFKKFWFQTHWLIGITAGVVLAVVGVTGGMLAFESEIIAMLNRDTRNVAVQTQSPLTPSQLMASVVSKYPHRPLTSLTLNTTPGAAVKITFASTADAAPGKAGQRPRGEVRYLDPYDGSLLADQNKGQSFFRVTRQLHRWLTAGEIGNQQVGKQIVGASTLLCVVLTISGLYLRWPRRVFDWRHWFKLNLKLRGRALLFNLHSVLGTWVLVVYLLIALTGLSMSYDWYRNGLYALTGTAPVERNQPRPVGKQTPVTWTFAELDQAWRQFLITTSSHGYSEATLNLPQAANRPFEIRYFEPQAAHSRASNTLTIEAASGRLLLQERYDDKAAGAKLMASLFPIHSGNFFGVPGTMIFMLASFSMPLFAITGWMLYLQRRQQKRIRATHH